MQEEPFALMVEPIKRHSHSSPLFPHAFLIRVEPENMREPMRSAGRMEIQSLLRGMRDWCEDQFGPRWEPYHNPTGIWTGSNDVFRFNRPEHAFAFKLRWV
ncbi:MAG: hypothetical protein EOP83_25220 [Verrucomicrobiaceae bacterium]|nr:MAG: hypothetical protein EOP83_25220 [Verrucomicrobiaceae bacterium]